MAKLNSLMQARMILLCAAVLAFFALCIIVKPAVCTIYPFGYALTLHGGVGSGGWAVPVLGVMVVGASEGGLFQMRMALAMRQHYQYPAQRSIWPRIGGLFEIRDAIVYLVAIVAAGAVLYALLSMTGELFSAGNYTVSKGLYIYFGGLAAYVVAKPRVKGVAARVFGWLRNKGPNYTCGAEGVEIDIGWGPKYLIHAGYEEVSDLRCFTPDGAETFFSYEIGPNIPDFVRSEKDIYRFFKEGSAWPDRLFIRRSDPLGTTVLMRGPSLLYFIGCSRPDCPDLTDAWCACRQSRGMPVGN